MGSPLSSAFVQSHISYGLTIIWLSFGKSHTPSHHSDPTRSGYWAYKDDCLSTFFSSTISSYFEKIVCLWIAMCLIQIIIMEMWQLHLLQRAWLWLIFWLLQVWLWLMIASFPHYSNLSVVGQWDLIWEAPSVD